MPVSASAHRKIGLHVIMSQDDVICHTRDTAKETLMLIFVLLAALWAAEGRTPDAGNLLKFTIVYMGLSIFLKISHQKMADQLMTAIAIGSGSKLLEVITKK